MFGISRTGDICIGIGSHHLHLCPHVIVGVAVSGSPDTNCNTRPVTRVPDIVAHSCPHCGIGVTLTGSIRSFCNNLSIHRIHDVVFFSCGIGITITGSANSKVEG
jgi:hypothetical protein